MRISFQRIGSFAFNAIHCKHLQITVVLCTFIWMWIYVCHQMLEPGTVWSLKNQHRVKTVQHRSLSQGERRRNRKRNNIQATGTGVISGQQALACACTAIIKGPPGSTPTTRLCFCHTATRQSVSLSPFEPLNKSFFFFQIPL